MRRYWFSSPGIQGFEIQGKLSFNSIYPIDIIPVVHLYDLSDYLQIARVKMIEFDVTYALGEVSGTVQLGLVGLVVVGGVGQMQVNLVNLLKDAIEIVLLSTMGEFEGFILSDLDESLQPFLGGEDAGDQAFYGLSVGRFVEVDIKRLIDGDWNVLLSSKSLKEWYLVGF